MLDKTHFAAALLSVGFVVFSSSCATVILSLNLQGWEWDYKEMQGHFRKIQRRVDLLLKYGLYVVDHNLMFGQWPTANSNVSWSSSAWDCTEAWEVVSLFVIPFSLTQFFKIILKIQKRHRYKPEVVCQAILLQARPRLQIPHGGQLRSGHLDWLREQCPCDVGKGCKMFF